MPNRKLTSGFSLVELMVAVLVAAMLLSVGIPAMSDFIATNRMAASANDLTTAIHIARSEAVKRRANATICPSTTWNAGAPTCTNGTGFEEGWIVFVDCTVAPPPANTCGAPNLVVDAFDTVVSVRGPLPDAIADNFATNPGVPAYLSFTPTGFLQQIGGQAPKTDFELCDHRGNKDTGAGVAAGRWIRISPTGRPQVYRDVADVQDGLNPLGGC